MYFFYYCCFVHYRFYDEIGTPLLSDIRIDYSPDSVEHVTQNMFYNYFNGSEIVVAGKLINKSSDALHVEITASNRNKYVVLEADVKIEGDGQKKVSGSQIIEDSKQYRTHVERLWGYLTFKELLTAWHKSDKDHEKEEITRKASQLAMRYNFVTPFTLLEVKDYGFQADLPKEESASFYTEGIGQKLLSLQGRKVTKGTSVIQSCRNNVLLVCSHLLFCLKLKFSFSTHFLSRAFLPVP